MNEPLLFTIPGNPITKKNSQRMVTIHAKGGKSRTIPLPSKQYVQYEGAAKAYVPALEQPIDYPVNLKVCYYMDNRRKVDLNNLLEATCDLLTHWHVLEDDNCTVVVSHDGSRVFYDKENPRAEVWICQTESTFP